MLVQSALALLLGLAAAAPSPQLAVPQSSESPNSVRIVGVSLLGTGCPAGTADVQVDATGELFEATFSAYEVLTGPGTRASDWRKNCKLTMNMEFDQGFQCVSLSPFAPDHPRLHVHKAKVQSMHTDTMSWDRFSIMATDMIGYAEIPDGARGFCKNTFSFTGQTSAGGIDKVDFDLELEGHYSGDFDLHADPGVFSWSPCDGSTAILNMNTQCAISPTTQDALIAVCSFLDPRGGVRACRGSWGGNVAKNGKQVDHVSGKLTVQFRLAWRPCPN